MSARFMRFRSRLPLPPTVVLGPLWRRRPVLCAALMVLAALALLGRGALRVDDAEKYNDQVFTVVYVADGDTFDIDVPDGQYAKTRIRLWGVDTPEVAGSRDGAMHFGAEASAFANKTLLGREVRVLLSPTRTRDKYHRLLAYAVLADTGQSYNELLLRGGYAYADWRFAHPLKTQYKALERAARKAGAGLWAQITPEQMPEWRRRMEQDLGYSWP